MKSSSLAMSTAPVSKSGGGEASAAEPAGASARTSALAATVRSPASASDPPRLHAVEENRATRRTIQGVGRVPHGIAGAYCSPAPLSPSRKRCPPAAVVTGTIRLDDGLAAP